MPSIPFILLNMVFGAGLAAWTNKWAIDLIISRVLPKKKSVFARRIQEVVSGKLLTAEKMSDKLGDPAVADLFRRNLETALADWLERDLPSPDSCLAGNTEELDRVLAQLRDLVLDEIQIRCAAPEFRDAVLRPWLERQGATLLHRSPQSLLPGPVASLRESLPAWLESQRHSPSLRRNLEKALAAWLGDRANAARTYGDLLPPPLRKALLGWVEEQAPLVGEELASALASPELQAALSDAVLSAMREQLKSQGTFGRLKKHMAEFIGVEDDIRGFCRRLADTLRRTLARPDRADHLRQALHDAADAWLARGLPTEFQSPEQHARVAGLLLDHLWRPELFADLGQRAAQVLEEASGRSLAETALKLNVEMDVAAWLDLAAAKTQRVLTSPATRTLLAGRIDTALADWRTKPLGRLARFVPETSRDKLAGFAADEARRLIQARLASFAAESGIWDIVTESIEGYSDQEIGDLVRQIADEEFKKITLLGGAIGLVVGFAQAFLSDFLKWAGF